MNNLNILEKLLTLKLQALSDAYEEEENRVEEDKRTFSERFSALLDVQILANSEKRINTLTKQAKLRFLNFFIDDIDFTLYPKLKINVLKKLATCEWIRLKQHVLIIGPTGTGKSSLACVLAQAAIHQHIPVVFYRLANLLLELLAAKNEGNWVKFIRKINRSKVLVLDDWGNAMMSSEERHLLFELIESRDKNSSLLITSQYPVSTWHECFQDSTIADSVLDRIVHSAHLIDLRGSPSIRELQGLHGGLNHEN